MRFSAQKLGSLGHDNPIRSRPERQFAENVVRNVRGPNFSGEFRHKFRINFGPDFVKFSGPSSGPVSWASPAAGEGWESLCTGSALGCAKRWQQAGSCSSEEP